MAFGGFDREQAAPMSDINVTPLVDVMLVLLVIFILTAPLMTHAVRVDLPQAKAQPASEKPNAISVSIDRHGRVYWDREALDIAALKERLTQAAAREPQPELHLHADRETRYQELAEVMAAAQSSGLRKIGFITAPYRPVR